ncbi:hypothetical protein [Streptomyces sp. AHA2]|uniref:hypothetical protein n=1 Tax=Streptomyces sp. AHA2 TaxID=3064526 RepID=UPI002FE0646F
MKLGKALARGVAEEQPHGRDEKSGLPGAAQAGAGARAGGEVPAGGEGRAADEVRVAAVAAGEEVPAAR